MRLIQSFGYAFNGIKHCFRLEQNFKIHLAALILVFVTAFLLGCTPAEWSVLFICSGMVLTLEMMNTAIEKICDLIDRKFNPAIKIIKNVAAGAVLISAAVSVICGCIIFFPKIILFLHKTF